VNADDFASAQDQVWPAVLAELRAGRKTSHWMWFVFPQIAGLGHSPMARRYALAGADEAREYLAHPVLGPRLREVTELLLGHTGLSAFDIFGGIDAMKLRSSMTLFARASGDPLFQQVLDRYFDGEADSATLERL
jgi:uncharacterized protein (DUF1810 family)